ncbi:hypothetical protein SNE40_020584 [Patella caerulea]|uniref:Uncharacterized protein n=1 Tax=Patella caerulea TaxID=87958 RepID=A0AAN8J4Q5_PATCE
MLVHEFLLVLLCVYSVNTTDSHLMRLHKNLFKRYNPDVRPVMNFAIAIEVKITLGLQAIRKIDENMETMVTTFWFELTWQDAFLNWNMSDYGDIELVSMPAKRIWTPDIYISNSRSNKPYLFIPDDYILSIQHNGTILWFVGGSVETHCKLNVRTFPFDTQICAIEIAQWSSYVSQVRLAAHGHLDSCMFEPSGTWKLAGLSAKVETICSGSQQMLKFELTLTRLPMFYIIAIIIPVCLLTILNPVVFLVPVESGEKISLAISILLSYSVILASLTQELPEASDNISVLGGYVCSMLCLKVVTVVSSVGIVSLYHRPRTIPVTGIYLWLATFKTFKNSPKEESGDQQIISWQDVSESADRFMFNLMTLLIVMISIICLILICQ